MGPADNRTIAVLTPESLQVLRDSVLFGRDGLGMINVLASGNGGGPSFGPGFPSFGNYDSASYNPYVNSRYTIGVTGVDHDGLYVNADGTFTSYPEAGASVLVAAPTGSNVAQNVANDNGQGSGIWTTDLVGDFGFNAAAIAQWLRSRSRFAGRSRLHVALQRHVGGLADRLRRDRADARGQSEPHVSRRAGNSASQCPAGTPNLRFPSSGGGLTVAVQHLANESDGSVPRSRSVGYGFPARSVFCIDRSACRSDHRPGSRLLPGEYVRVLDPFDGNDLRQIDGHYEPQPGLFTNGAGYTVSQGYGVYGEPIGYAHGVIDAELAVEMAKQWHILGQNMEPFTEKTYTTFVLQGLATSYPPKECRLNSSGLLVPGGIGRAGSGFIAYWNEYFATPASSLRPGAVEPTRPPWPQNTRGISYIDFSVPPSEQMNVEWVEVKVSITGPPDGPRLSKDQSHVAERNAIGVEPLLRGSGLLSVLSARQFLIRSPRRDQPGRQFNRGRGVCLYLWHQSQLGRKHKRGRDH